MKILVVFAVIITVCYLLVMLVLFVSQRSLIFHPSAYDSGFDAQKVLIQNGDNELHGWVINPDKNQALIYFGGNSEQISGDRYLLEKSFPEHSVYLIDYPGYGKSDGKPSEKSLFTASLTIYQHVAQKHSSITLLGRSLGTGVAVYLASQRQVEKLILLTPYDSITAVAQAHYPMFPVKYLITDRFDSLHWGKDIDIPVLVISAEFDLTVPKLHAEILAERLTKAKLIYLMINAAAHDDITEFPQYHQALKSFIGVAH